MKKRSPAVAAAALLILTVILAWDRLLYAFFSPEGVFLRALPAVVLEGESEHTDHGARSSDTVGTADMDDGVDDGVRIELLNAKSASDVSLSGDEPRVLIYHTHATEAYLPTEERPYDKTTTWRTDDTGENIVAIGAELTRLLTEEYGISVIHDKTNYEPPRLGTSYERSLEGMEAYKEKYPSIELFIDVHRDAYTIEDGTPEQYAAIDDTVTIDGIKCARMMFVVGTGEGQTGAGFSVRPNYVENYALALKLTEALEAIDPALMRPIRVKTGRYNQHVGTCLLIEVGHNANTIDEALSTVPHLARAIAMLDG